MKSIRLIQTIAAFSACLFIAALCAPRASHAGTVTMYLTIDPVRTAFSGVPAVGGFSGTSTRSGPGTWHLFAVDEADGSFGIAQVKAQLIGTVPAINNRMTQTLYDTADDSGFKTGLTLLRSGNNVNPITASSELPGTQPFTQGGLGITAGNYSTVPGATAFSGTTNGQWGNYNDGSLTSGVTVSGNTRSALFLAEGTYTGAAPTIDLANSFIAYWTNAQFTMSAQATVSSPHILVGGPTNPFVPEPSTMALVGLGIAGFCGLASRRHA